MFNLLLGCLHLITFIFSLQYTNHALHLHIKLNPFPTIASPATPTPPMTPPPTASPTAIPTDIPTPTSFVTPTASPTPTTIPSPIASATPTPTLTITVTPTFEPTASPPLVPSTTPTATPTIIPSNIPTATPTAIPTDIPTPTSFATPTASPTPTLIPSPTATPTATPTDTPTPTPTAAPTPTPTITKIGNDISYPQCPNNFPSGQGFGIVGINGGIATTTNPCLSTELLWATQSLGTANQAKVQLYVNTGNPGLLSAVWPKNNTDPQGNVSTNPNGACDGSDSLACAWQYGWNRAVDDVQIKFIPAAHSAGVDAVPADYPWWLDVETANSWESGTDGLAKNRADLEGMVAYLTSKGITVGVYSTSFQWGVIAGTVAPGSSLNGLRNWRPGASDLTGAQNNCSLTPLTPGGTVVMTQFTSTFDYDYSCL